MRTVRRWMPAGALPVTTFILGVAETRPDRLLDMDSLFSSFMALVCLLLVFWWYCADAFERGYRRSWGLNVAMLLFTPVAVPWYLARSRDGLQVPLALLCAVVVFVLCGLGYALGSFVGGP